MEDPRERGPTHDQLAQVRVYPGLPSSEHDPKAYSAARPQIAAWESDSRVKVFSRPLRYPQGWPDCCEPGEQPCEKGVDVEFVVDQQRAWGKPRAEVPRSNIFCHWLTAADYPALRDDTDYTGQR